MDRYQFGILIAENMSALRSRALKLVRNVQDAEDILQEAILRSFRNKEKLTEDIQGYLYASLRSAYLDLVRSRKRREACPLDYEPEDRRSYLSVPERVELSEVLDREIRRLPPRTREIMQDYAADFSYEEIADRVGVCEGTVKSTLHRARKRLQESLTQILEPYFV